MTKAEARGNQVIIDHDSLQDLISTVCILSGIYGRLMVALSDHDAFWFKNCIATLDEICLAPKGDYEVGI